MDAWFGGYVGLFTPQSVPDWEFHCRRLAGEEVDRAYARFAALLRETMAAPPGGPLSPARAETAAELLCVCGQHWKRTLASHDEFLQKVRAAVELCIAPAGENKIP